MLPVSLLLCFSVLLVVTCVVCRRMNEMQDANYDSEVDCDWLIAGVVRA